jgi:hypothetical protein
VGLGCRRLVHIRLTAPAAAVRPEQPIRQRSPGWLRGLANSRTCASPSDRREKPLANRLTRGIGRSHGEPATHNPTALYRSQSESPMVPVPACRLRHADNRLLHPERVMAADCSFDHDRHRPRRPAVAKKFAVGCALVRLLGKFSIGLSLAINRVRWTFPKAVGISSPKVSAPIGKSPKVIPTRTWPVKSARVYFTGRGSFNASCDQ